MALLLGLGEVADDEPRGTGRGGAGLCRPQAPGGPPRLVVDAESSRFSRRRSQGDMVGLEVLQACAQLQKQQTHLPPRTHPGFSHAAQEAPHKVGHCETGNLFW